MGKTNTHFSPTVMAYAVTLLEVADERGQTDVIAAELADLRTVIAESPEIARFFADPIISADERGAVVERVFKAQLSELGWKFVHAVDREGQMGLMPDIAGAYDDLLAKKRGRIDVEVTVARPLDDQRLAEVAGRIGSALGKEAVVSQRVDESIIGGLVIEFGDKRIDASVRRQLSAMREKLLAAAPR